VSPGLPEVAIVIPCHGYAHFLREAVASAVAQTWPVLHIVVVDDGSPDATAAVAEALQAEFPERRITLVRQANQGLGAARNTGVRATRSPFVLPLDADDRLEPRAVERLLGALLEQGGDVATPLGRTFGQEQRPLVTLPVTRRRLCAGNCLVYASLYRRELFDRVGGYVTGLRPLGYEDWDFWLAALAAGAKFVHVPEELFGYRRHGVSMLSAADAEAPALRAAIALRHPGLFPRWRRGLARLVLGADSVSVAGSAAGTRARRWWGLLSLLVDRRLGLFWRQLRGAGRVAART
jgi:glycosyltransferase involved in cell wall biosynthesis